MSFLDSLRMKVFEGYEERKEVSVDWWSGSQHADPATVLKSREGQRVLEEASKLETIRQVKPSEEG